METELSSFRQGTRASLPALPTIFIIFLGFGITSRIEDVPVVGAMAMTLAICAAPAQYAILDMANVSANPVQLIIVGTLANLRFFLISINMTQMFRGVPLGRLLPWAQFVAATPFLLTFFRSRKENPVDLFDYFRGIASSMIPVIILGTAAGLWMGAGLPGYLVFGATLFMPIYFSLLLATGVKGGYEFAAVGLGFAMGPIFEALIPGWGLLAAAMVAGLALTMVES